MAPLNYEIIRKQLEAEFAAVDAELLEGQHHEIDKKLRKHFEVIFKSKTQAYREVLLGCLLARLHDRTIDIRKPYMGHGESAYNGRTLDERVVNPFLTEKRIPSSRGPFLSTFRRSVEFDKFTRDGLRDKAGYDSLLALIDRIAQTAEEKDLKSILRYLLSCLVALRTATQVPLSKLQRISLEQYGDLIDGLLSTPSGGRFPLMLAEVTFTAIKRSFKLDWKIEVQGINAADRSSGPAGTSPSREVTPFLWLRKSRSGLS